MDEEIIRSLNRKLDVAIQQGRDMIQDEQLQNRLKEVRRQSEDLIRRYPVQSIGIGLFAGFIIGRLLNSDD